MRKGGNTEAGRRMSGSQERREETERLKVHGREVEVTTEQPELLYSKAFAKDLC